MSTQQTTNRPVHSVRYGGVKASVWLNQTRNGPMYNVTITRSYKVADEWKESASFGYEDLLLLAKSIDECHSWIHGQIAANATGATSPR